MLPLSPSTFESLAAPSVLNPVFEAFRQNLPGFTELDSETQHAFVIFCYQDAKEYGMVTEMGIGAFGLASWWLGLGCHKSSQVLEKVLQSSLPEIRKIHSMNEWARVRIAHPGQPDLADQTVSRSVAETEAWGQR